jgi:Methyltransferase domain
MKMRPGTLVRTDQDGIKRKGEVLEVVPETATSITLRIRWQDGQETRVDPTDDPSLHACHSRFRPSRSGRHDSRNFLLKMLPRRGAGAEVGVWKGDFAEQMLRVAKPRSLYLVDPWEFMPDPEHAHTRYGGSIARSAQDMEDVFAAVQARFRAPIDKDIVHLHRGTLGSLAESLGAPVLDWIYIDGDHNYKSVSSDLRTAAALVRPGGYIMGDDYRLDKWWKDAVVRAVSEVIFDGAAELELVKRSQYVLKRTGG